MGSCDLAYHRGKYGVWMVYLWDVGPVMQQYYLSPVDAIDQVTDGCKIGFWPRDMSFREGVDWWENPEKSGE